MTTITIAGSPDLNSTEESTAGNAAVVRLYELSNETIFKSITIESFWRDDVAALGSELVASPQQFLLYPSEAKNLQFTPRPETRYIGVAADLRKPDLQNWRQIIPVEALMGKSLLIQVVRDRVVLNLI